MKTCPPTGRQIRIESPGGAADFRGVSSSAPRADFRGVSSSAVAQAMPSHPTRSLPFAVSQAGHGSDERVSLKPLGSLTSRRAAHGTVALEPSGCCSRASALQASAGDSGLAPAGGPRVARRCPGSCQVRMPTPLARPRPCLRRSCLSFTTIRGHAAGRGLQPVRRSRDAARRGDDLPRRPPSGLERQDREVERVAGRESRSGVRAAVLEAGRAFSGEAGRRRRYPTRTRRCATHGSRSDALRRLVARPLR